MTKPSDLVDDTSSASSSNDEPQTNLPVYLVAVERSNNEKISAEVFGYEIPVLRALHGDQAITFPGYPVDAEIEDVEPSYEATIDGDANSVLKVLQNKYDSPQAGDVVMRVYRNADELSAQSGIPKMRGKAKGVKASENTDNRKKK